MDSVVFLSTSTVVALNEEVLGRPGGLIDEGKLAGGLQRVQMVHRYEGGDLPTLAAYVIAGVTLAHGFADGNKRTALYAATLFLVRNGRPFAGDFDYLQLAERIERFVAEPDSREAALNELAQFIRGSLV